MIYVMPVFMGIDGIPLSAPIADSIAMAVTAALYKNKKEPLTN